MTSLSPAKRLSLQIGNEPSLFDGHFPGNPILPGAKLLDLVIEQLQARGELPSGPVQVTSAKFLATVAPLAMLELSWNRNDDGLCRFECFAAQRKVAQGSIRPAAEQ